MAPSDMSLLVAQKSCRAASTFVAGLLPAFHLGVVTGISPPKLKTRPKLQLFQKTFLLEEHVESECLLFDFALKTRSKHE